MMSKEQFCILYRKQNDLQGTRPGAGPNSGVGNAALLVTGTTLRFTVPVPTDSRQ